MAFSHSGATAVGRSGDDRIDGLLAGFRWTDRTLLYSDPNSAGDYGGDYFTDYNGNGVSAQREGFSRLDGDQLNAVHAALDAGNGALPDGDGLSVQGFTDLRLNYAGSGSGDAEIRVANTDDFRGSYAYYPAEADLGGDVWLGGNGEDPRAGNLAYSAILHELGHALGLKHSFENDGFGAVPEKYDSPEYTVMTYRRFVGDDPDGGGARDRWSGPQSYMMLDVAALQHMYGADYTTNGGNTVYKWSPENGRTYVNGEVAIDPGANRIFATIWDGGGTDTYDLRAYSTDLDVDLRPGKASFFKKSQLVDLSGGPNDGHARGSIFNALLYDGDERSLIERVKGGKGDDSIHGNDADNRLWGKSGDDSLKGGDGEEKLYGGSGNDRLRGRDGDDWLKPGGGKDRVFGGSGDDTFVFRHVYESRPGKMDTIEPEDGHVAFKRAGRSGGDVFDLSDIDADETKSGDQDFKFDGKRGAGHLWTVEDDGNTILRGNIDDRPDSEFKLTILDGKNTHASDYEAQDFLL